MRRMGLEGCPSVSWLKLANRKNVPTIESAYEGLQKAISGNYCVTWIDIRYTDNQALNPRSRVDN